MYQEWRSLLFLHWKMDPEEIQSRIPLKLKVDTYQGSAYIGIVPFYMHGLRPKFGPPCPGISHFPELNLRTYVRDQAGRKGVWFFSLDAHSRISVAIARSLFGLPYHYAKMDYAIDSEQGVTLSSQRKGADAQSFTYRPTSIAGPASKGSLEHFLVERYRLFTQRRGELYFGELSHQPYGLSKVDVPAFSKGLFSLNGFETPSQGPDHLSFSSGVKVEVYALKKLEV